MNPTPDSKAHATARDGRGFMRTQLGNAERLVASHGNNIRYCHPWEKWLVWDGRRWQVDNVATLHKMAKSTIRAIPAEASNIKGDDDSSSDARRQLLRHAAKSETKYAIGAMIDLARSQDGIPILPEQLDRDPMLLNCLNGTVDLRTGKLLRHSRDHLITKVTRIRYEPNAMCPEFLKFLNRILSGDAARIEYVQKVIGYALTGSVVEKALFVFHGSGDNGKTTFLEAIRHVMDEYSGVIDINALMQNGSSIVSHR
ncbi:MAG: hypothetical protein WCB12_16510 [Bryobacteraceae bacterium]